MEKNKNALTLNTYTQTERDNQLTTHTIENIFSNI